MNEYVFRTENPIKCCGECSCFHAENPMYCQVDKDIKMTCPYAKRMENCPLKELPPHGRLGDLDKLASKVAEAQEQIKGKNYDPFMLLGDVLRWIGLTSTVIEASKS